ncbi:hypothetical protein GCM10010219_54100 [Streptomyces netropsis]|nr:hypothetical protein GCM10010219_54100 [Streptomyces netropsis]
MRGVQGLAHRPAQIGLQGVAVAAVVTQIGIEGRFHGVGVAVQKVERESALFEDAGGQPDELFGTDYGGCSGSGHVPTVRAESGTGQRLVPGSTLRGGILGACG